MIVAINIIVILFEPTCMAGTHRGLMHGLQLLIQGGRSCLRVLAACLDEFDWHD
jgi:hypothetical protein